MKQNTTETGCSFSSIWIYFFRAQRKWARFFISRYSSHPEIGRLKGVAFVIWLLNLGVNPKIMGKPPNHPFVHRVWNHDFHHPFWGKNPPIFGNTCKHPIASKKRSWHHDIFGINIQLLQRDLFILSKWSKCRLLEPWKSHLEPLVPLWSSWIIQRFESELCRAWFYLGRSWGLWS